MGQSGESEETEAGARVFFLAARDEVRQRERSEKKEKRLTAGRLVEVDVDALELKVRLAGVGARGVDAVLVADDLFEMVVFVVLERERGEERGALW